MLTDKQKKMLKNAGLVVAGCAVGAFGVILVKSATSGIYINNNNMPVINIPINSNNVNFGGHTSKLVEHIETGEIYRTVTDAANAADVTVSMMSKHLNGHTSDLGNRHFKIIGLSTAA